MKAPRPIGPFRIDAKTLAVVELNPPPPALEREAEPVLEHEPKQPPCLEEYVYFGYNADTYAEQFSGPEWGPTWSNPNWQPPKEEPTS
jgi:hypothetical protein